MKYLKQFISNADYREALENGEILTPSITEVEGGLIYRPTKETHCGDVCVWDKNDLRLRAISSSAYAESYWQDRTLVPIGIVAVPSTHTPDGTSRVMSLVNMSSKTPNTGTAKTLDNGFGDEGYLYWGQYGDIGNLENLTEISTVDKLTGEEIGTTSYGYIPRDFKYPSDNQNTKSWIPAKDPISGDWWSYSNNGASLTASPFDETGHQNPLFYKYLLGDMNGKEHTEKILNKVNVPNWQVDTTSDKFETMKTADGFTITWESQDEDWIENSESNAVDGKKFTSVSPGDDGSTVIRCTFSGAKGKIIFSCLSDGEHGYDYLTVGELDEPCDRYSNRYMADSEDVLYYVYEIPDTKEHYVEFCYSKDSSDEDNSDSATIFVVKSASIKTQEKHTGVINEFEPGRYPAAMCCWRFFTVGTNQGDWYLPAIGECAFMAARTKAINDGLMAVAKAGYSTIILGDATNNGTYPDYFWSSSEYDGYVAWYVGLGDGYLYNDGSKDVYFAVRAFSAHYL